MPTYTYTHGSTTDLHRLRLLAGDHRGTVNQAAGWLFSDEELGDILLLAGDLRGAVALALLQRANREALSAGVAGTTDTTERPQSLHDCARAWERAHLGAVGAQPTTLAHSVAALNDAGDVA